MASRSKVFPGRNRPRTTRGRPRATPYHPNLAAKFTAQYHEHDAIVKAHEDARQAAFIGMLKSGMTTYQIAQEIGLAEGSVRYWADAIKVKRRRLKDEPAPSTQTALKRQAERKNGSLLFN